MTARRTPQAPPATGWLTLARPLNGITTLRNLDPYISDLAALLTGVKPVIYLDFSAQDWPYLSELIVRLRLKHAFPEELYRKEGFHLNKNKRMLIFGPDAAKVREAARQWSRSTSSAEWGLALGYPECCVKTYLKWLSGAAADPAFPDIIRLILKATPGRSCDFRLNNVYNYYSRLVGGPKDLARFFRLAALNPGLAVPSLQVISWHPCSYSCPESSKGGGRIFDFMSHYLPGYAALLRARLARPMIFFDKYEFLSLEGGIRNGKLRYKGKPCPVSLAAPACFKKLTALSRHGAEWSEAGLAELRAGTWKQAPEIIDFR